MKASFKRLLGRKPGTAKQVGVSRYPVNPALAGAIDRNFYLSHHPDVASAGMDPAEHYDRYGWKEGRDPSPWFSTRGYLNEHQDVAKAGLNPFVHFLETGRNESRSVRPSEAILRHPLQGAALATVRWELDPSYYSQQLQAHGLHLQGLEPALHYILIGAQRNLDPTPWFSTRLYSEGNPDIVHQGVNPFLHYLVYGRSENRLHGAESGLGPVPETQSAVVSNPTSTADEIRAQRAVMAPRFSIPYYLGQYPDIAAAGVDPLGHFAEHGWREGRNPSPHFSVSNYLEMNEDVRKAGINPFYHYIVSGEKEGRLPKLDLGFRPDILKLHTTSLLEKVESDRSYFDVVVSDGSKLIGLLEELGKSKGLYLSFSHDDFTSNFGGVQLILQREFRAIRGLGYHHIHVYPKTPLPIVEMDSNDVAVGVLVNGVDAGAVMVSTLTRAIGQLSTALKGERWFAVHSLLGHSSPAVEALLKAAGCKRGWFWAHDYAAVCANYTLLRNDVEFCAAPPISSLSCSICRYGAVRPSQVAAHGRLFDAFDVTLAGPSQTSIDVFRQSGLHRFTSEVVLEHCRIKASVAPAALATADAGVSTSKGRVRSLPANPNPQPLKIGFLGLPANHKGWPAFLDLALLYAEDPRYEFHVFGKKEPAGLPIVFHEVVVTNDSLDAMTRAIDEARIDVAVMWSIWPETFCFAAHEALAGGATIVTHRDSGHVARMVTKQKAGLVLNGEKELNALFGSGEIEKLARSNRKQKSYSLSYSNLTADLLKAGAR